MPLCLEFRILKAYKHLLVEKTTICEQFADGSPPVSCRLWKVGRDFAAFKTEGAKSAGHITGAPCSPGCWIPFGFTDGRTSVAVDLKIWSSWSSTTERLGTIIHGRYCVLLSHWHESTVRLLGTVCCWWILHDAKLFAGSASCWQAQSSLVWTTVKNRKCLIALNLFWFLINRCFVKLNLIGPWLQN